MKTADLRSAPVRVNTRFSFNRNVLIDGIIKHSCVKKRVAATGMNTYQFRDSSKEYGEDVLRGELERLSRETLMVILAAFMRNTDALNHGFVVRIVRCYVEAKAQSKGTAEAVIYYAARLSNVLINFSSPQERQYDRCISIAADVVSSAHLFKKVDDRIFRSGSFYADRSMKGIAAWFCMGREKLLDVETLHFLSKHLDLLTPHADEIRQHKIYSVETLQGIIDRAAEARQLELEQQRELEVAAS